MTSHSGKHLQVFQLGMVDYIESLTEMRHFAQNRDETSCDQIWLLEHPPVYTQGTRCTQVPLLPSDTPVVKTDRGGQITYHGPGQIIMYPMLAIKQYAMGVKALVHALEQSVIDVLASYQVLGERRQDAPGVYVQGAKIAALGLRIRRGRSYHGLSFNVDMDLLAFNNIDPCGFQGMQVTQLHDQISSKPSIEVVKAQLLQCFLRLI